MCQRCEHGSFGSATRRGFLRGGMAALAATALPGAAFANSPSGLGPDTALERLMAGNARYVAGIRAAADYASGRAARALSQHPIAAILGCADSRVAPELAFDEGPGNLFMVRVAGNFVSDNGLASLEYAVKYLGTPLIMVLGHSSCGAVDAAIKVVKDGLALPGHLPGMLQAIKPAAEAALASGKTDVLAEAIAENVRRGATRLTSAEPIIGEFVASGRVKVVGATYDIASGRVSLL